MKAFPGPLLRSFLPKSLFFLLLTFVFFKQLYRNIVFNNLFAKCIAELQNTPAVDVVAVQGTANGAIVLGFDSTDAVSPTVRHRCDVSSEQWCPGAEPQRWPRHSLHASAQYPEYNEYF